MGEPKRKSVNEKTFKKYPWAEDFSYELDEEGLVTNVVCLVCSDGWDAINKKVDNDAKLRGQALDGVKSYVDGVSIAHRFNMKRHVECSLHLYAKNLRAKEKGLVDVETGKIMSCFFLSFSCNKKLSKLQSFQ